MTHDGVPTAFQAMDQADMEQSFNVDLILPPFTHKETMALRDKASFSGSAAGMPTQVCLTPEPPLAVR